ncbi:MAG: twin-arginine translocation signal domain-containing protein, partial [Flavobacteriales bacterium]
MKRRDFIKKAGLTTAGAIGLPYILPSGRLFAASGRQMSQHVVLVMFAG